MSRHPSPIALGLKEQHFHPKPGLDEPKKNVENEVEKRFDRQMEMWNGRGESRR